MIRQKFNWLSLWLCFTPTFLTVGGWTNAVMAQTVLESVLQRVPTSGLFVNAAQNGFGPIPLAIDARIITLFDGRMPGQVAADDTVVRTVNALTLGNLETIGLGATNAGTLILSISAVSSRTRSATPVAGLTSVAPAVARIIGENSSLIGRTHIVRAEEAVARSRHIEFQTLSIASISGSAMAALNLASNASNINARVTNRVDAAVLNAQEMTATALGAVNVGLVDLLGESTSR